MVALNLQTRDENFAINSAFFEQNSGCGYVLKPVFLSDSLQLCLYDDAAGVHAEASLGLHAPSLASYRN